MQLKPIFKSASTGRPVSRPVSLCASQGCDFCFLHCARPGDASLPAGCRADAGPSCSRCLRGVGLCRDGCYCPGESGDDLAGQTSLVAMGYRLQRPGAAACSAGRPR